MTSHNFVTCPNCTEVNGDIVPCTDLTVDLTRATTAELIQANHRGRQALTAARATRRTR